ncbi:MAG: putative ABC transporter permease, partial [Anaerovoracaceae bacterium]
EKPALTFFLTMGLCGVIEYATSWWLEYSKGTKWWDYSGYLLNLNGRICLEGLLVFAIGGCAFVYILAPLFDDLYNKIPNRVKYPIVIVLLTMFGIDSAYSHFNPNTGPGITDYGELEYRIMGLSEPETSLAGMAEPHIKS